jgi:hypothetical protein
MSPSLSPVELHSTEKANRIPAAMGFVADAAGVVAFALAGVKVVALVLGAVAVLLGAYLIVKQWGRPFRTAALRAVLILAVGIGIVGVVVDHQFSSLARVPLATGVGASPQRSDVSTPQASIGAASPSQTASSSVGGATPTAGAGEEAQSASPSIAASPDANSPLTSANLGDPRQGKMTNANGFGTATQVAINTKTFMYGLSGCKTICSIATSDFNLSRSYSTLTARLGVLDTSRTGGVAHIQILADGNVIESKAVQLGASYDIRVSVKNVLRLQFVESNDGGVVAAVGDPTVIP